MSQVATHAGEMLTPREMMEIVVDWTGGCRGKLGNTDVIEALLGVGVTKEKLVLLALALVNGAWTRHAIATLILEMLSASRVRAAVAVHGHRYHGLSLCEARRDVRSLRDEAREMAQREVLATIRPRGATA